MTGREGAAPRATLAEPKQVRTAFLRATDAAKCQGIRGSVRGIGQTRHPVVRCFRRWVDGSPRVVSPAFPAVRLRDWRGGW
jgi:hypothetical protein